MNPNTYTGDGTGLMPQSLDSDIEEVEIPIKHESKPYLMIPFPDGATNGDMIKALFPRTPTGVSLDVWFDGEMIFKTSEDWWNAPYKSEREDKE